MHGKGRNMRKIHNAWKRTEYKKTTYCMEKDGT